MFNAPFNRGPIPIPSPGWDLATELLAKLTDAEQDFLRRWGADARRPSDFVTGFLIGRFSADYPVITLANAARAIIESGELVH